MHFTFNIRPVYQLDLFIGYKGAFIIYGPGLGWGGTGVFL